MKLKSTSRHNSELDTEAAKIRVTDERVRVQLDFSVKAYNDLLELKRDVQAESNAETIRYALKSLQWIVATLHDNQPILVGAGNHAQKVVFPFLKGVRTRSSTAVPQA